LFLLIDLQFPEVPMNVNHLEVGAAPPSDIEGLGPDHDTPTARAVLEELFLLLEDYAPTWYTVEHHNRAVAALLGRNV
jgi:hypothetical protein